MGFSWVVGVFFCFVFLFGLIFSPLFMTGFCFCCGTLKYLGLLMLKNRFPVWGLFIIQVMMCWWSVLVTGQIERKSCELSLSLGNLPKAAIIPQFELLELFRLYRFAKHVVKIKLRIFPWDFPGVSETWLLQQKPWSESFCFYCPFGLASFSDTWNLTACLIFPSMISYNNQMQSTVTH